MPGSGPITIFDKSALQSLSGREALWFDCFYSANITPLFYIETLANLYKEMRCGRTPDQVVADIASKTPDFAGANADHLTLCVNDLLGFSVPVERFPVTVRGRSVMTADRLGVVFEQAPEIEAFERWQRGEYLTIERQFARSWRLSRTRLDLSQIVANSGLPKGVRLDVKDFAEAKKWADRFVRGERNRFSTLKGALETIGVPQKLWSRIVSRWKADGGPPLTEFAPYAAHVFNLDIFFFVSLAASLISTEKASNQIDIAYLYYLPFCMVFVSGDNLHKRVAPLFMGEDQQFVWAPDLKADLARIDEHYSRLPEAERDKGLFELARHPPLGIDSITTQLWKRFLPGASASAGKSSGRSGKRDEKLVRMLDEIDQAPEARHPVTANEANFMMIKRMVRPLRAGWRVLPREVEEQRDSDQ